MIDISVQASLSDDESERVEEVNHTLTLDVEDPFKLSTQVMYRHASKTASDGVEGWATVMGLLSLSDKRGMTVESIEIEAKVSHCSNREADDRTRLSRYLPRHLLSRDKVSHKVRPNIEGADDRLG